jgi:hypothetical protein
VAQLIERAAKTCGASEPEKKSRRMAAVADERWKTSCRR